MTYTNTDIFEIELELTWTCNLNCPLCARNYPEAQKELIKNIRPFSEIKQQLNEYPNLKYICCAGIISEPTLYPELFSLINYCQERNILLEIYTNGDLYDNEYWEQFGKICTTTKVYFTICGSTQELHSKYRVGSKLDRVLDHSDSFRKTNNTKSDFIQYIVFNYNEDDFERSKSIREKFSNQYNINSLPYQERFQINSDIKMPYNMSIKYDFITKYGLNKQNKKCIINCKSKEKHFIAIDQFGKITPCFLYRLYSPDEFNLDYSKIENFEYSFCYECESSTCNLLEKSNMERMA